MKCTLWLTLAFLPGALAAQAPPTTYPLPKLPPPDGYRVYIIPDMEGMGSVVNIHEVIAGIEGKGYANLTGPDYWGLQLGKIPQGLSQQTMGS